MMMFRIFGVAAATLLLAVSAEQATIAPVTAAPSSLLNTRGSVPKLPADEKTTKNCVWWIENDGSKPCLDIPGYWGISFVDWFVWNPSLTPDCDNFLVGRSYCVKAKSVVSTVTSVSSGTTPTTFSSSASTSGESSSTATTSTSTSAKAPNGIATPEPTQPELVKNCNKFQFIIPGQSCIQVASENGISTEDFSNWNPKANYDCSGLLVNAYSCVSIRGSYDFEDANKMEGWSIYDGSYDSTSKALVAGSSAGGKALINSPFTDFAYEADVTLPTNNGGSGNAGLIFRATNAGNGADSYNGYYAGIGKDGNNGFVELGRADGGWKSLSRASADIQPGRTHRIKIRANGDLLQVYVDDLVRPKIEISDGSYRSGSNGVRVYQTAAVFDNIQISSMVYDGFEKNMVGWKIADGTFNAGDRVLDATSTHSGKAVLDTHFIDFVMEADMIVPKDTSGNAGILFRASDVSQGPDSYRGYYVGLGTSRGGFLTLGRANYNWSELKNVPVSIQAGQVNRVMLKAVGDLISIFVDDFSQPKIVVKDGSFKSGVTGVRVYQTGAFFDNIRIQKLD